MEKVKIQNPVEVKQTGVHFSLSDLAKYSTYIIASVTFIASAWLNISLLQRDIKALNEKVSFLAVRVREIGHIQSRRAYLPDELDELEEELEHYRQRLGKRSPSAFEPIPDSFSFIPEASAEQ